jgi:hypothetical protein
MKNSFKYSILLLLLSFLIATLCCSSHGLLEKFTEYPFTDSSDNDLNSLDNLQKTLFKYNRVISEKDYDIPRVLQDINSERQGIKYQSLLDSQPEYGNYRPFEARILSDNYRMKNTPSKVKGKRTIIDPGRKPESLAAQNLEPQVSGGIGTTASVKERSIRGDFYYEQHSCEGEWSDWTNDHCGTDRDRCGIMFKKYEIIEREKNDPGPNGEPRPGKPCEYKDGMIKYKYCFGGNADDYESNMERCDMSANLCPCKLKNETLLHGENVYDLEDDNCLFELQRECLCPRGYSNLNMGDVCKLEPGTDCSIEEPGCIYTDPSTGVNEECKIPSFINQAMEDEFKSSYSSIDGKCKEKKCNCSNGVPIDNDECVIDGQESCKPNIPCNEGYYMTGNPPTCKKQSEGDDIYKECSCLNGDPRIEAATETRCNPNNATFTGLLENDPPKQRQHCETTYCSNGYRHENDPRKCDRYYSPTYFHTLSCCIPKYDTCELEEDDLVDKNIVRKDPTSLYSVLSQMNLGELKTRHNGIAEVTPVTSDELIVKENPKAYLITKIIQASDDTDDTQSSCSGNITVGDCYTEFKCKPGYAFLPLDSYSSENELRITECVIKNIEGVETVCEPIINSEHTSCLSPIGSGLTYNVADATLQIRQGTNEIPCMFPSYTDDAEIIKILTENGWDTSIETVQCAEPTDTTPITCSDNCQLTQVNTYYPEWNGTCVPVTCPVTDEIKEVYNISYDNCPSDNMNCGLNNVTCKNASFEVHNTREALYCQSPQKVGRDYLTVDFPLIDIGCLRNPPPRSSAEERRRERMASAGDIISGDASDQASQRQGPDEDNIERRADFTGSTENQQLEFELGRQGQLESVSEETEGRTAALASVVGGDQMRDELDTLQGETRQSR